MEIEGRASNLYWMGMRRFCEAGKGLLCLKKFLKIESGVNNAY
jgi:hypothetical protein